MKKISFDKDTSVLEIKAHFVCRTQAAAEIAQTIRKLEADFSNQKSYAKRRDVDYPGTHGCAAYDLLMFTILHDVPEGLEVYIDNRYPLFGEDGFHQLLISIGKNFADTGYQRPDYSYTDLQKFVLKEVFGKEKVVFRNPGYIWRKEDNVAGFWRALLRKRRKHPERIDELKDELEDFQVRFGEEYQIALQYCDQLPQVLDDVPVFILNGHRLKLMETPLYFELPDERSKQVDKQMHTCKELFEQEFVKDISYKDGMRELFYHSFNITEQELQRVAEWLDTKSTE